MRTTILFSLLFASTAFAQDPEAGVKRLGSTRRLLDINTPRPLLTVAKVLVEAYQLHVNSEDPPFSCADDVTDMQSAKHDALQADHFYVPKGGVLRIYFSVDRNQRPVNPDSLLANVVATYNQHFPFRYRLLKSGDVYSFVPVAGRNDHCREVQLSPQLDRKISIPKATRTIDQQMQALSNALRAGTGEPALISLNGVMNSTIPGLPLTLEARDEPARDVLLRIIRACRYRFYWIVYGNPFTPGWSIILEPVIGRIVKEGSDGGFSYPYILWPGAQPPPPLPPPPPIR